MLQFHPDDRITVEDALHHPYLKDFRAQMSEPVCPELFNFDFERADTPMTTELSKRQVQQLMFDELQHFRPIELESKGGSVREDKKGAPGAPAVRNNYSFAESKTDMDIDDENDKSYK